MSAHHQPEDNGLPGVGSQQAGLLAGVLDALPAHVALLNGEGVILSVNRRWRDFAEGNGFAGGDFGVGMNYLGVCEAAKGDCEKTAGRVADGIRSVLAGKAENHDEDYECHSPTERRWFRLLVAPVEIAAGRGAVVMHINMTEQQLSNEALAAQEARLRAIYETEPECVKVVAPDGRILEMNPAGLRMVEAGALEEVSRLSVKRVVHRDDYEGYMELHNRVLGGESGELEFRILGLKGTERWMETHSAPLRDTTGAITGVLSVTRDITRRRVAEERLRLHASALEAAANAIVITDREGAIEWTNPAFTRMTGYSLEEAMGKDPGDLIRSGVQGEEFYQEMWDTILAGKVWRGEIVNRRKDGTLYNEELTITPVRDERGETSHFISIKDDVTEKKNLLAKVAESEERFRNVAKATVDVIWDWSLVTNTAWWNDSLQQLFGHDPATFGGDVQNWIGAIHPDDRSRVVDGIYEAIEHGPDVWEEKYRFQRADGDYARVVDRGYVMRDRNGNATRMVGGITDITAQLSLEEQLRQSQRLESIGQLTGGIAHDFNNLLTVIMGNADLLQELLGPESDDGSLAKMICDAAERGSALTHRLLAFSRKQALDPKQTNLNRLISGMDGMLRRTLGEHIEIELVQGADLWPTMIDPAQLESSLLNLCLNARDAMPEGGRLTIETGNMSINQEYADHNLEVAPGQYVLIAVSDTGHGIPREAISRVFEPFFTTKQEGKGTGLGLSMVYGFVKQSHGHIKVYSEVDEGTTFRIYLPRLTDLGEETGEPVVLPGTLEGTERVLVVEDDELVRKFAVSLLEGLGYELLVAESGPEALEILQRETGIDLLFTDVVMPGGMNGRQLAEEARRLRPGLKVLYTSGYTQNAIVHHGRLDPGAHLLNKPYGRVELARKIREVLAETQKRD